ncbi:rap guanine nucleotide exchange factor-like 1 [Pelobates cultripes]|uniref:Rap guanine nucleotide exchange factor-like 1 n=1 Tax=Pelobates cultripes TaxID=61616 RepID=A0AAD1SIG4_PELCU|nr:rap guanine nucleotide exchange factor-like 1 [Pelobates cultripes]
MKPLEKFLKKQSSHLSGPRHLHRRQSVSKILPSFLRDSPSDSPGGESREEDPSGAPPPPSQDCLELPDGLRSPLSFSSDELSPSEPLTPPPGSGGWTITPPGILLAPDTPEALLGRILDQLLTAPRLSDAAELALDDFILTHTLFMPTEELLRQLQPRLPYIRQSSPAWEGSDTVQKKQAVLCALLHLLDTYKDSLQEEERTFQLIKDFYVLVMRDAPNFPQLEGNVIRLHRLVETAELRLTDGTAAPCSKQVKPLFRHFRRIDSCLQPRVAFRGSDEIFCRVYMPDHSYVTIRSRLSASVSDILTSVSEKLQYSEEQVQREEPLVLVAVTSAGDKVLLKPDDGCIFTTLGINSHLFACNREELRSLVPLPEEVQLPPEDPHIHRIEAEDLANHLSAFHWELFSCIHELEFVDYVFHAERGRRETANLELLLQRCSEVQHWVSTQTLLCEGPARRTQLLKKFIKTAAICKQNQDLLSFFAIVMGLDNGAVSRLRVTWEKLPGKFKNLFRKFENLTDPCRNHKSYREMVTRMRPPVIPFIPLILKDLTFLHEGSKTFLDGLVNVEKMHAIAEKVRTVRKYRSSQLRLETDVSPNHLQNKAYVRQFQVIDNQNLLFELSYKLEPNAQ